MTKIEHTNKTIRSLNQGDKGENAKSKKLCK